MSTTVCTRGNQAQESLWDCRGNRHRMGHWEFLLLIREAFCPMRVVKHWNRPSNTQNSGNKVVKNLIHTGLEWDWWVLQNTSSPPACTKV